MPRFNRFLVWATVCLTASSTPLEELAARGSFSLQQVAVESEQTTLEEIVARHYWKYGFDAPKPIEQLIQNYRADGGVSRVAEPGGGSGTVTARPVEGDKMYLIETQVGRHKMRLDLDTGSADLYVHPLGCKHVLISASDGSCQPILSLHTNPNLAHLASTTPKAPTR